MTGEITCPTTGLPTLLLLRPGAGAAGTLARAGAAGIAVIAAPLFALVPLDWPVPDPADFDLLIVSSANVFVFGGAGLTRLRALPVHAVGGATAAAARAAGFTVAQVGAGGIADLLAGIDPAARALRLTGRDHVAVSRPVVCAFAVYAADPLPLPDAARTALQGGAVALLHSPRAARHFAGEVARTGLSRARIRIAALSPAIADAAGVGWARVTTAPRPDDDALLSALAAAYRVG